MALSEAIDVRLVSVEYGVPGINVYRFRSLDGSDLPSSQPGAHIDLELDDNMVRQYSLVWPQPSASEYCIAVQISESGRGGSRKLHAESVVGDSYRISPPRNHFALGDSEKVFLFAGGIGITPIISMYRQRKQQGLHAELFYWVPWHSHLMWPAEMAADDDIHIMPTREPDAASPRLEDVLHNIPEDGHLYCCGPTRMMDSFDALVSSRPPGNIHTERFSASEEALQPGDSFRVTLKRSGLIFDVPPELSLLEVCEDHDVEIDYSCEEGICGACKITVLEGEIDHRDSVFSAEEKARGNCMMACCSRAKGTSLVLDL